MSMTETSSISSQTVSCNNTFPIGRDVHCTSENDTTKIPTNTSSSSALSATAASTTPFSSSESSTKTTIPAGLPTSAYVCNSDTNAPVYCIESNGVAVPVSTYASAGNMTVGVQTVIYPATVSHPMLPVTATSTIPAQPSSSSSIDANETSTYSIASGTSTSGTNASGAAQTSQAIAAKSTNNGVSNGTVAGVAIGLFLAGALIAGIIAFFLMRKSSKTHRYATPANYSPAPVHSYGSEKGTPMVTVAPVAARGSVLDFLPQQADDAEVRRKLSTVIDQIDQHVENFYANRPVPLTATMEGQLSQFETAQLPQPLVACFEQSNQPAVLIKHCLTFHIFNLTMAPGEGTTPILPPEMAGMVGAVYNRSLAPNASKDTITAFTTWKQLTAYLRPDLLRDPATMNASADASTRIANHLTTVFAPWRNDTYSDDQRSRHLTELLGHAIHTSIWLFSHPDSYKFNWNVPVADTGRSISLRGRESNKVVIAPGVSKLTHGGARLPGAGQQVLVAIVKRL